MDHFLIESVLHNDNCFRILDYGCGNAQFVVSMTKAGFDVVGVDIDPEYVRLAKSYCETMGVDPDRIVLVSEKSLPFADTSFDCIYSNTVLEHVIDVTSYLSECQRLLKPDGFFLATVPPRFSFTEGHIPLPLAHWLPSGGLRRWYIRTFAPRGLHELGSVCIGEFFDNYISRLNYMTVSAWKSVIRHYFGEVHDVSSEKKLFQALRLDTFKGRIFLRISRMPLIGSIFLWVVKQATTINLLARKPFSPRLREAQ
jgi:ubiquinone/menaquinone biosynthesis C-methylase UbiE